MTKYIHTVYSIESKPINDSEDVTATLAESKFISPMCPEQKTQSVTLLVWSKHRKSARGESNVPEQNMRGRTLAGKGKRMHYFCFLLKWEVKSEILFTLCSTCPKLFKHNFTTCCQLKIISQRLRQQAINLTLSPNFTRGICEFITPSRSHLVLSRLIFSKPDQSQSNKVFDTVDVVANCIFLLSAP